LLQRSIVGGAAAVAGFAAPEMQTQGEAITFPRSLPGLPGKNRYSGKIPAAEETAPVPDLTRQRHMSAGRGDATTNSQHREVVLRQLQAAPRAPSGDLRLERARDIHIEKCLSVGDSFSVDSLINASV